MEKTLTTLTDMISKLTATVDALSAKLDAQLAVKVAAGSSQSAPNLDVAEDEWFDPKFIAPLVKGAVDRHSSAIAITGIPCSSKDEVFVRVVENLRSHERFFDDPPTCWTTESPSPTPIGDVNSLEDSTFSSMLKHRRVPDNSIIIIDLHKLLRRMTLSEIIAAIPHCNSRNAILIFECNTIDEDGKILRFCQPDAYDALTDYEGECQCHNPKVPAVAPCIDMDVEPLFKACLYRVQTTDDKFALRVPFKFDLHDGLGLRHRLN
jgi:hypothetical protein